MKKTFPYYIEDWLLWLAAKRTATGDVIDFPWYAETPISLANYDVSFIMRTSSAIDNNIGLTEKQRDLAVKIVTKYQRQIWSKLNKDVSYLKDLPHSVTRLEVREVDKTCSIESDDKYWYIVFPYDPPMVDQLHKLSAHSAGVFKWEGSEKRWHVVRNERNLWLISSFIKQWKHQSWDVDNQTQQLLDQTQTIIENSYNFLPHVDVDEGKPFLVNSNPHIDQAWQRVDNMDLYNTVFRADSMGLAVSERVKEQVLGFIPNVGPAMLTPQWQINTSSKTLYTHLPCDLINDFAVHIHADNWVFISYDNSNNSGLLEAAIDADVNGEKIFFSDKVPRLSYSHFSEIKDLKGDTILFVDNLTVLEQVNSQLAPEFPILKTFYSHGGKR